MLRTVLGSLSGFPVSLFIKDHLQAVLVLCGKSLLIICRKPRIIYSRSVQRKTCLTQRNKTTNLISHEGISSFTYFKSNTTAAQTEFWHSWRTSPGGEQGSVFLFPASKRLSTKLWFPRNNYWCKNSLAEKTWFIMHFKYSVNVSFCKQINSYGRKWPVHHLLPQESGEQFFWQINCISFCCMHKELLY